MTPLDLLDTAAGRIALWAAGVAGGLYLLRLAWRALRRSVRGGKRAVATVNQLGEALLGDPENGIPSTPERLKRIEAELHPNGGSSLRDAVNRTETELAALRGEFAAHLAEHARTAPVHLHVSSAPPGVSPSG